MERKDFGVGEGGEEEAGAERWVWIDSPVWARRLAVQVKEGFASTEGMRSAIGLGRRRNGFADLCDHNEQRVKDIMKSLSSDSSSKAAPVSHELRVRSSVLVLNIEHKTANRG